MESPLMPVEVIRYILRFLCTSDRKEASLVNRTWYAASLDRNLQKNVSYNIQGCSASLAAIEGLGKRRCPCVAIRNLDESAVSKRVVQSAALHLAPHLGNLCLHSSNISEAAFMTLIPCCLNLARLDISSCNSLFMPGTLLSKEESRLRTVAALVGLQHLNLSNLRFLSDLTFTRLTDCTPSLMSISLSGCHIAFRFDPYQGTNACNSTAMLSLISILRFIRRQAHTLRALNFSRTGIGCDAVRTLVQVEGLCLEELVLQNCKDLSDEAVSAVCRWQPGLTTLDLTGCTELTDKSAITIASGLLNLRHLYLGKIRRLTDVALKDLLSIPSLQTFDVSECYQITGSELVKGLSSQQPVTGIVTLNLNCCGAMRDASVFSLAKLLGSSLWELDLTSCVYITDISVRAITSYLRNLKVLRLGWCKEITDWGLLGKDQPTSNCGPDKEQCINEESQIITQPDIEISKEKDGASLGALMRLKELKLTACTKLTDASITKEIRFEELQALSLSLVNQITDESMVSIALHCPSLERLSVSHCSHLTDKGMMEVVRHTKRLTHLDISCCDKITDRTLDVLAVECKWLKSLDVSMCSGLTIASIERIQTLIPTLTSIQARFIAGTDLSYSL
eukprot:gi/632975100/ref/XP_007904038.1/ PREDICTED: leucine-rich repeat-containing protein 29 isoform X2 [Callorhinchus milii]